MSEDGGRAGVSLYVNNIPYDCQAEEVKDLFDRYGRIRDVYLPRDYYTKRPRGFAYVEFEDERDAEDAMESLHRRRFHGRELVVEWAKGKRKTGPEMRQLTKEEERGRGGRRSRSRSPRRRRSPSPRGSRRRSRSPIRRRSPSPRRRRSPSPRRRSPSPRRRSPSPRRRSPSPRRPARRSPSPTYQIRDEANGRDDEPETP